MTFDHTPSHVLVRQWLTSGGVFVCTAVLLALLGRFSKKRLVSFTRKTGIRWDNMLLTNLEAPAKLLIVLLAAAAALQAAPQETRMHPAAVHGVKIALVLLGLWILDRVLQVLFRHGEFLHTLNEGTRTLFLLLTRLLTFSITILIVLDTMGISITPILASLGIGSVAVALALQDTLGNLFSGFYMLLDKPIRIGDFIRLDGGLEGHVKRIGWRSTHILLLSNNMIVVPNSRLSSQIITNFNLPESESAFLVPLSVAYDSDLSKAERVLLETASQIMKKTDGGAVQAEPLVRFGAFGNHGIECNVVLRAARFTDSYLLKHEFIKAAHARLASEGITIPYPQTVVHMAGTKEGPRI
ncbi:MAG: hypothetical protein A2583_11520 [Bdellovibrionales bacterium RIFOXYD1_FULL_53_11]|nr:MAG: hypothetical protein A2583_11520 [Bdellovibrionales bacterium RIFOXYD1_FULL_53_11]